MVHKEDLFDCLDPPTSETLTYVPDIPAPYVETVTVKTTTTTVILNDGLNAQDLLDDIERVS